MHDGDNVYHILGPTLRDESDTKKQDKQEWGKVYHVLEGPTLRDDNSDRNPNVYHVLEGPAPRDENLDI